MCKKGRADFLFQQKRRHGRRRYQILYDPRSRSSQEPPNRRQGSSEWTPDPATLERSGNGICLSVLKKTEQVHFAITPRFIRPCVQNSGPGKGTIPGSFREGKSSQVPFPGIEPCFLDRMIVQSAFDIVIEIPLIAVGPGHNAVFILACD